MSAELPPVPAALEAAGLVKVYRRRGARAVIRAVDDVSLRLESGRVLALVGESGSGKSTVARLLTHLERPTAGLVLAGGTKLPARVRRLHRQQVQMVFQDPFASLNPAHTIGYHIGRSLLIHHRCPRGEVPETAARFLEQVNLSPGEEFLGKLPHQLSGGQRQRAAIAAALAVGPRVLLADEPVSMLDASIRASILALLRRLAVEQNVALLYITHDVASARFFADSIAVMYRGRIVERGPAAQVVERPEHPYTQLLVAAAPRGGAHDRPPLPQRRPGQSAPAPSGPRCEFADRCPHVMDRCTEQRPPEFGTGDDRFTACWLAAPSGPAPDTSLLATNQPNSEGGSPYAL
jgi:peptide/nickel transport system ATP-binding protein